MHYKLGLVSDVHATAEPLAQALALLTEQGVDKIICLGDIAGYGVELDETIKLLEHYHCQSILGNHDLWYMEKHEAEIDDYARQYFSRLPRYYQIEEQDIVLYCVHASPPDELMGGIRLYDENAELLPEQILEWTQALQNFDFQFLFVGHTHQYFDQQLANTRVINPGSTKFNNSCAMLTLPEQRIEFFSLDNKPLIRSWNWSKVFASEQI
ncbi:MAG: metallophosphoesterase family protein [Gammaproteobacteria bacterium]|nr:metallophosphoesterase family protein [Gammaproteobacteria bacterium]